jgi:tetratricopeptide (TPR) repeat protein
MMATFETAPAPGEDTRRLLEADDLIKRGHYQEALALIEAIYDTSRSPRILGDAVSLKSLALRRLGRLPEALAAAEAAAAASPDAALPQVELAIMLAEFGRLDRALAASIRGVELAPHYPFAWELHSQLLCRGERGAEALGASERALTIDSNRPTGWYAKGDALSLSGRHTEAVLAYDEGLRLDPERRHADVGVLVNRARALFQSGGYSEAVRASEEIRQRAPSGPAGWEIAGASLTQLRRFDEALEALDRFVALQPNVAVGWRNRGTALYSLDRLDEALDAYDLALALDPTDSVVRRARSEVLAGLAVEGRLPARIDLDAEPDLRDATPWLQAARRLRHYKRYDAALAACDEAIARAPGDPEPLTVKYVILRNRLRWREALPLWREMTRLHMEQWRREQALRDEGRR